MKAVLLFLLTSLIFPSISVAQSGPGGVGNSSNNILWLDANQIVGLADSTALSNWADRSGNSNHSTQISSLNRPLYRSNQVNGLASVQFDGLNDYLNMSSNIATGHITAFFVYRNNSSSGSGGLMTTEKHAFLTANNRFSAFYNSKYNIPKGNNIYGVINVQTDGNSTSSPLFLSSGASIANYSRNGIITNSTSYIGKYTNLYLLGNISEVIIYNELLNSAKRKIVSSHLAAKYNLTAEQNLYTYKIGYGHGVKGIGQEVDGNHLFARAQDSLAIDNASALGNGDYLLVGHNNAGYGTSTAAGPRAIERWNQVWRADITGTPGTVDLEFFLGSNGFAPTSNYVVLMETADGDFTNGGTSTHDFGRSYDPLKNSIKFSNVNLVDGAYFTLAEIHAPASSVADGNWDNQNIWSCECVPSMEDIVITRHNVTIQNNQSALDLHIEGNGSLIFSGADTLFVHGDFLIEGSISSGQGTIAAVNNSTDQFFYNNSLGSVDLYNLFVNNSSGLTVGNGDWSIRNNLQVSNGGMDVSNVNSITLLSDASATAQILPSMDNAFTGDFIVQRFIGARTAGWSNLSSAVENATIADWDDDLYMSGVNGNDGNVTYGGGNIYYTVFSYDYVNDKHDTITSTSTALSPTKGYEVWLADNSSSFFGKTIDVKGTPNSGNYYAIVNGGWNFVGNPYQSFIAYDNINKSNWVPDNYYIWNTNTGNYDFFNGAGKPAIAPGQGFWINKITAGNKLLEFTENTKIASNSSSFLRKKSNAGFSLNINSTVVPYSHKMQVAFSTYSTAALDEKDGYYLKSRNELAPSIVTKIDDQGNELIYSSLNPLEESQVIPISIYAGLSGNYQISAENVDALTEFYNCAFLVDKQNNVSIDLLAQSSYSFDAEKGSSDRFDLILSKSQQSCLENTIESAQIIDFDNRLILRKEFDQWYLDYNLDEKSVKMEIQLFNMNGQEVIESQAFVAKDKGSYQLKKLNELHGIYLIYIKSNTANLSKIIQL